MEFILNYKMEILGGVLIGIAAGGMLLNSGYSNFGGTDAYQAGPGNGLLVFKVSE